jgi:hypothetical protein
VGIAIGLWIPAAGLRARATASESLQEPVGMLLVTQMA